MKRTTMTVIALAVLGLVGCKVLQQPTEPRVAGSPGMPPNYETPDSQFVPADFNKLASEFLDEYVAQYVVFDGRYMFHRQGAVIYGQGRPYSASGMMMATIGSPGGIGSSLRNVNVLWSAEDRELGRTFLNLPLNAPVKIYAYVLPARKPALIKSRHDRYLSGFPSPVLLLIKAVPTSE